MLQKAFSCLRVVLTGLVILCFGTTVSLLSADDRLPLDAAKAISPSGQIGDEQTSLVYFINDGELAIDAPASTNLTSINIDSAACIFTGAPAQNLGGSFDNDSDCNIFKATFGTSFGSLSFGPVTGSGHAPDFLCADLTVVGSLWGGGGLGEVDLIVRSGDSWTDEQTSIVYDPATGELAVNAPASTNLTSINIDSAACVFTGAPAQNLGGSFDNDSDCNIFKATFGTSFGSLSFGPVAQPDLSRSFLEADLAVVGSLDGGGGLGIVNLLFAGELFADGFEAGHLGYWSN